MKKLRFILYSLILLSVNLMAQDTLKVLHYNLLYYGLFDAGCTSNNNNVGDKTNYLKTIISYSKPDIFSVNEINANTSGTNYHDYLLYNVFTLNNLENFQRASVMGSYLTSQIYYNTNKLTLKTQDNISAYPRDIYAYKFYYNSPDLNNGDTVFFTYYLAHLKGGSDQSDKQDREDAANSLMSYIDYYNTSDNYLLAGDLNLYTSTEQAYQRLTNYSVQEIRFADPGIAGNWHNNETYKMYHTQSSFYDGNGCAIGGGLDDRFDFIMFSNAVENNSDKIEYIDDSFIVIGQDGNHFNSGVGYQGNSSVPSEVLDALSYNSDHLPVYAEFLINQTPAENKNIFYKKNDISIRQDKNKLYIQILDNNLLFDNIYLTIYNTNGKRVLTENLNLSTKFTEYQLDFNYLANGIYLFNFYTEEKQLTTEKILIK